MKRILIIGGYGTFGGRLAKLLAVEDRLTLIIAGRSHDKAAAFCETLPAGAEKISAAFDRDGNLEIQLRALTPDIVIDATGPFQMYGDDPYRVAKAALALGIHYLDLADGSDFVAGIGQFDNAAKEKNIFILSGVSTCPVLTAAVVRRLAQGLMSVEAIRAGIAPSPFADVGLNVVRAIAGYAGKPVALWRGGAKATGYALTETMHYAIAPPGRLPLGDMHFSLVDVPDLRLLPLAWPGLQSVWFGAGPRPESIHYLLNLLAWLVRLKIIASLEPMAAFFHRVLKRLRGGAHRGGMFVEVEGTAVDGRKIVRSWHLVAEGDDGPFIPSMPAAAIIHHCVAGNGPAAGARPAMDELELIDYDALFALHKIYTGFRQTPSPDQPLFQRVLGEVWDALPQPVRAMHARDGSFSASGRADIDRGYNAMARFIATCAGFPPAGRDVPVKVSFSPHGSGERWQRDFAGRTFVSYCTEGRGRMQGLLCERFGPLTFGMGLVTGDGKMHFVPMRASFLGFPLPGFLVPGGETYESEDDECFHFHVEIKLPFVGLIVRYKGWLVPH